MTPKQRAIVLALKFTTTTDVFKPNKASVKMAIKCVNIILNDVVAETNSNYWQEVATELGNLSVN